MPNIAETLIAEIEQEAATTRRVLERVPSDKLGWRPHEKSMTLGQLAFHVADVTGGIAQMLTRETFDAGELKGPEERPVEDLLPAFESSVQQARDVLQGLDDQAMMKSWVLTKDGQTILEMPRIALARSIMMNHLYHHRGQLSVYLRLLDVPVPSIYGPSADENPFA
ncbi:MAG: DinB family protein [Candidatus Zixiibacteriota bacterium]